MSDFIIYENPGNKAARLERENAQLRAENRDLRARLGEQAGQEIASQVVSAAPRLPPQTSFTHGACSVTIGARPGARVAGQPAQSAIPSLEQEATQEAGAEAAREAPQVQIYDTRAASVPQAQPVARAAPVRRMVAGQPAGGGMTFDLAAMRPVPVKPSGAQPPQSAQRLPPGPPAPPTAIDDARKRFQMLELDLDEASIEQNQTGHGQGKTG